MFFSNKICQVSWSHVRFRWFSWVIALEKQLTGPACMTSDNPHLLNQHLNTIQS